MWETDTEGNKLRESYDIYNDKYLLYIMIYMMSLWGFIRRESWKENYHRKLFLKYRRNEIVKGNHTSSTSGHSYKNKNADFEKEVG